MSSIRSDNPILTFQDLNNAIVSNPGSSSELINKHGRVFLNFTLTQAPRVCEILSKLDVEKGFQEEVDANISRRVVQKIEYSKSDVTFVKTANDLFDNTLKLIKSEKIRGSAEQAIINGLLETKHFIAVFDHQYENQQPLIQDKSYIQNITAYAINNNKRREYFLSRLTDKQKDLVGDYLLKTNQSYIAIEHFGHHKKILLNFTLEQAPKASELCDLQNDKGLRKELDTTIKKKIEEKIIDSKGKPTVVKTANELFSNTLKLIQSKEIRAYAEEVIINTLLETKHFIAVFDHLYENKKPLIQDESYIQKIATYAFTTKRTGYFLSQISDEQKVKVGKNFLAKPIDNYAAGNAITILDYIGDPSIHDEFYHYIKTEYGKCELLRQKI